MSATAQPDRIANRGLITIGLMIATLMQALDSTIANVALPYMQGSLSASYDQITWVLTSYVVAAAIMTAPVGWLTARFGRKNLFITCLVGFTVTSMLCGIATSLPEIVIDRLLQGSFGAALVPLSQSTMLDIYPPAERAAAISIWSMGVLVGPVIGPTLGGYLTSHFSWHYVFFVNLPFGILATSLLMILMPRDQPAHELRFDWLGFSLLSLGLAALQIMLDRGEELDWFSSHVIIVAGVLAVLGLYLFTVHMFTAKDPFISQALFKDLNFITGLIAMFCVGIVILASTALLPPYLENMIGFPVQSTGMVMAPRGLGTMVAMFGAGRLANKLDPRLVMLFGYLCTGISLFMIESWTPAVSSTSIMTAIALQGFGLGCVFVPLQVVAFYNLPPVLRTQGAGLLNLIRNVGSAIGVSLTSALLDHQSQYEHAVLTQYVTPFTRIFPGFGMAPQLMNPGTSSGASMMNAMIDTQAQIIAYTDDYKFLLLIMIPAMLCLLIVRPPKRLATLTPPPQQAAAKG